MYSIQYIFYSCINVIRLLKARYSFSHKISLKWKTTLVFKMLMSPYYAILKVVILFWRSPKICLHASKF